MSNAILQSLTISDVSKSFMPSQSQLFSKKYSLSHFHSLHTCHRLLEPSGGSKGALPARPPPAQNFLNFMHFFGNFGQICMLAPPPGGLAPPPTGNPGSAPGTGNKNLTNLKEIVIDNYI